MAEVFDYFPGDLSSTLAQALSWLLDRQNANVSPFAANAITTPTDQAFVEGGVTAEGHRFTDLAQEKTPNIVLDPMFDATLDAQAGPDGFPINYSPVPLLSGDLLVNILTLTATSDVSGRVANLLAPAGQYRVDLYTRTTNFNYQGSSTIAGDYTWRVADVPPGSAIAFLMPSTSPQPEPGSSTPEVSGWVAHSNLGVGHKLRDYFVRVYVKTEVETLWEDNIPIIVQDAIHARFGSSKVVAAGTPVAHILYNHPELGPVDLFSSEQRLATYPELLRAVEIPPGDPDFLPPAQLIQSNLAYRRTRCGIEDAALAIIAFSLSGHWDVAQRLVKRLNALREDRGYLPTDILEDAEDGSAARWTLENGTGEVTNVSDPGKLPAGSKVISFQATDAPTTWSFTGAGLPDSVNSILQLHYGTQGNFTFSIGVTSSNAKVTTIKLASSGTAGYHSGTKAITVVLGLTTEVWRCATAELAVLIGQYVPGETLTSVNSFRVTLEASGTLRLDDLSLGGPVPEGSLNLSYDLYHGQVDQASVRTGAVAWVCYAYGIYMERTGDFLNAALGLQSMLNFLFSLQCAEADLRQNLILRGWGHYENPGYRFVPGQLTTVSTAENVTCYYAFEKASLVLPSAAQHLLDRGYITQQHYNSLQNTVSTAIAKGDQIRAAILNQLWIAAAGDTKGHFAQGASSSGLDTALALEAAGSRTALFCNDIGEADKAVETLEFVYETFLRTNQQILKDSAPESYNQTYEQRTTFDGFKPYADSEGGYSGSPDSVATQATWSTLAAYLRMVGNADLEAYFAGQYDGGLAALISRLVQSMKTVGLTTGHRGLLGFTRAARSLPWEFFVWPSASATAWFWITATRNDILFCTTPSPFLGRPVLKVPRGVEQSIRPLEGQGSIGSLEMEVIDGRGYITALASAGKLEGRKVTLKVGYPGMATSDFVTLATQEIEAVQSLPNSTGYMLQCRDLKRSAKTKIFARADDGYPTSKDHSRTLVGNPMDIVLMVFQNELGLGQSPSLLESAWKLYDPAQWSGDPPANATLIRPNPYVDVDRFLAYRHDIFAGCLLDFQIDKPTEAKQFLEYEVFRPLGGYLITLPDGRLSPRFLVPPYEFSNLFSFNERNLTALPQVERHPIINQVSYRLDFDGRSFQTELLFVSAPSLQRYGLAGQHIIEAKGLQSLRGGAVLAALTATRLFARYAGLCPVTGKATGGAPILSVTTHFMTLTVEVGDYVYVSHPALPDLETGRRGVFNRIFEVIEKQPDYARGMMTYRLLDAGWLRGKQLSRLASQGTPAFPAASPTQRARYLFIADHATKTYTDGTSAKTIF